MVQAMSVARKRKWWYGIPVYVAMSKDDLLVDQRGLGFVRSRITHHRSVVKSYDDGGHELQSGQYADEVRGDLVEFFKQNRSR
jgi:esterase/lipase